MKQKRVLGFANVFLGFWLDFRWISWTSWISIGLPMDFLDFLDFLDLRWISIGFPICVLDLRWIPAGRHGFAKRVSWSFIGFPLDFQRVAELQNVFLGFTLDLQTCFLDFHWISVGTCRSDLQTCFLDFRWISFALSESLFWSKIF